MIVDCHTRISHSADDVELSAHLAAAETVNRCIVLADSDGPSEEINKRLSEYVTKHQEKMVGFATIDPIQDKLNINKLKDIRDKLGLKGVVLHCCARGLHPTHSKAIRFYESAQELGFPVFFHNGHGVSGTNDVLSYAQPYLLDEIARGFSGLKIIIGNMGIPFLEQTLSMVAKHKNVYADLTIKPTNVWQTYNTVVAAYEHNVMDKLLFGSGFPMGNAGECIETLLGFNMLLADTNLPTVPRCSIRNIIERDTLELLGIKDKSSMEIHEEQSEKKAKEQKSVKA
ncbi:MAG: amidohydrolase family protein [Sedimentisphaerales bacterium]|nr:amidohydrolase family protein [Sedimentisphaerales bacterium]